MPASGILFSGQFVKTLKDQLRLRDTARILTGTQDPRVTATDAETGSILLQQGSGGKLFLKNDDGVTTNWSLVSTNVSATGIKILEAIRNAMDTGVYRFATPAIAAIDQDDLVATFGGTAAFDTPNEAFSLPAIADSITSVNLLDEEEFIDDPERISDIGKVQIVLHWNQAALDEGAVVEISRNGGTDYYPVTMTRLGNNTEVTLGTYEWSAEETNVSLLSDIAASAGATELNATTQQQLARQFTVAPGTVYVAKTAMLRVIRVGTVAGTLFYKIVRDNAGLPSTDSEDIVAVSDSVNAIDISTSDDDRTLTFGNTVLGPGTYHLVLASDASYKSSFVTTTNVVSIRTFTGASITAFGAFDGTVWAELGATLHPIYDLQGRTLDLRLRITSSQTNRILDAFTVFYKPELDSAGGVLNYDTKEFDGLTDNTNVFSINFTPDYRLLNVFHVQTGQVYKWPAFTILGNVVTFPANTFKTDVSETVTLKFTQTDGSAFDTSDQNGQSIATLNQTMDAVDTNLELVSKPLTKLPKIAAPFSTLVNRALVTDFSNDLMPRMGIERIPVLTIEELQNESDSTANSSKVWKLTNDLHNRFRFVGVQWNNGQGTPGLRVLTPGLNDYVEIVFYGTSLNLLTLAYNSSMDLRASVDGGAEGGNIVPASLSSFTNVRGYRMNQVLPIVSGLALGLHTVKLRNNSASPQAEIFGFEIINNSTTGNITTTPGSVYSGKVKETLPSASASLYNTFNSGTLGTRGGHAVVYMKDGVIGKAVNPCDTSSLNLAAANHANEEVIRSHNFREFGQSRTDDFGGGFTSTSERAFTLDDGSTALCGPNLAHTLTFGAAVTPFANGAYFLFTFVGTGLDVLAAANVTTTIDQHTISVDGSSIGTWTTGEFPVANEFYRKKIVSGLPYGTHTVRFTRNAFANSSVGVRQFFVYGTKKPAIPTGAIELADYYVNGNYSFNNAIGQGITSQGVIRKMGTREMVFTGSGWNFSIDSQSHNSGFNIRTPTTGDAFRYTFYGTGLEFHWYASTVAQNFTISIDGSTNLTGFSTGVTTSGGLTITPATGIVSGTPGLAGNHAAFITGLALGLHTIVLTRNVGHSGDWYMDTVDVITPIHAPDSDTPNVVQSSLMIGSNAIGDLRNFSEQEVPDQDIPNWGRAVGITASPSMNVAQNLPIPEMGVTIKTKGNPIEITFTAMINQNSSSYTSDFRAMVNGVLLDTGGSAAQYLAANDYRTITYTTIVPVPAGVHRIDMTWWSENVAMTITAQGTRRALQVKEIG